MSAVRSLLVISFVTAAVCAAQAAASPGLVGARAKTTVGETVRFRLTVAASAAGQGVVTNETGTISFTRRRARLYKLVPNTPVPQELIMIGPFTYSNANVQAAMNDPKVKPWTKLDTRRLTAKQRSAFPDELAHVRAVAYLADGVSKAERIASYKLDGVPTTRFRGRVDPARVLAYVPPSQRAAIRTTIRNDYLERPFPAEFWVDRQGRLRRVTVAYRTARGLRITIDGRFSHFGAPLDLKLPPKSSIKDISP